MAALQQQHATKCISPAATNTPAGLRNRTAFQVVSRTGPVPPGPARPRTTLSQQPHSASVCAFALSGRLRSVCVRDFVCLRVCVALCAQPLPELVALTSRFLQLHGLVSDVRPQRESAESREVSPPPCSSSMSTSHSLFSECVLLLLPGRFLLCTLLRRRLVGWLASCHRDHSRRTLTHNHSSC